MSKLLIFALLTLLTAACFSQTGYWSLVDLRSEARQCGQWQRVHAAGPDVEQAFEAALPSIAPFRGTEDQCHDAIRRVVDRVLPANFLAAERAAAEAEFEAGRAEARAQAEAEALKARQDSAIAIVRGSSPADFPDGQFIQTVADMFGITTTDELLPARVHQIASRIWSSREAGRLMDVAKDVQSGRWDVAKADRKSPSERLSASWANQTGSSSGVGDYRACTAFGCGAQTMKKALFERATRDNHKP